MTNTTPGRSAYLPVIALALLALIWGYNWVVMKVGIRYADPFTFAALRTFLGSVVLFAIVAARRGPLRPPAFWLTVVFSLFQIGMAGLAMWALHFGGAGRTSVLVYTMPFWVLLFAWPVLGEKVRGVQWLAAALALAGLVFVLDPWSLRGLTASVLAISGGLSWAIASVIMKVIQRRQKIDLLSFTAWHGLIGSIPLIVAAVLTAPEPPRWTGSFIAALVYNVIPASALAWWLWLYVLHSLPAGIAGISSLAIPVVGVAAAWIQLGERPGALEGLGMGLIVAALAVLTARGMVAGRRDGGSAPVADRRDGG